MRSLGIIIKSLYFRLLYFLIIIGFGLSEQKIIGQEVKISGEIKWKSANKIADPKTGSDISVLYFENAVYNNPSNHLPYLQGFIKLDNEFEKVQVVFMGGYFEEFKGRELSNITNLEELKDSITINYSIGQERKQPYLMYSFVPLRRNAQTGKIERLRYFSLKIVRSKVATLLKSIKLSDRYVTQSVLNSGDWYKFYVDQSGMYKITYSDLKSLGLKNLSDVRIYGNGGKVLPQVYAGNAEDDLKEIPILMVTGSDGVFNDGDYIVFYAEGPVTWNYNKSQNTFSHQKHPFVGVQGADRSRIPYYITSQPGGAKVIQDTTSLGTPTNQVSSFDALAFHEKNSFNFLQSGQAWYGEVFNLQGSTSLSFSFPNLVVTEPVSIEAGVVGRSGVDNYFSFSLNNNNLGSTTISPVVMSNSLANFAQPAIYKGSFLSSNENISLTINYNNGGDPAGQGWLSYIRMVARENLKQTQPQFTFRDSRSVGKDNVSSFTISGVSDKIRVWDVTNINSPFQMQSTLQNNTLSFKAKTDSLREFVSFNIETGLFAPEFSKENNGKVPNQNLHGLGTADLIIIAHPDFMAQAQRLANLHSQKDGLTSIIVTPDQIYNEFSSGKPDPAAIRNFMKMFYDRASSDQEIPKYLLLFGDGSYDNRVPYAKGSGNSNFIMTYESINSLDPTNTFVSDDYFGLLGDNETIVVGPYSGNPYTPGLLDIGIGRIPVDSAYQATDVVNKIEKYMKSSSQGDWRNSICFVGDDEDDNIHMEQADQLATYVNQNYPTFNVDKIYLDAYQQVSTSTGARYPDVNKAITNQLNQGLLIFNYTGHGGEGGLAHEQIMQQNEDIKQWKNDNYPLFVTATCDFARFDKLEGVTAGEDVLLNPKGGGIGLFTTNRLVYSAPNFVLNQQFYNVAFIKSNDNLAYRLGDIIRKTKNNAGIDINKLNFALLGDPALSLAYPKYRIITDSINHKSINQADTLKAYENVSIQGHIADENGNALSSYNGVITPTLFDKTRKITTLANDGGDPFNFNLQDKILFKGKASVTNGKFNVSFVLPRDMDYNYGLGRISYYASDSVTDASGYYNQAVVGGLSENFTTDNTGPQIKLYMNDTTFLNGGITDAFPALLARVSDDNGINPGGNGLGHDITAIIDNDPNQSYVLNNFFQTDIDNYKQGSVLYKFSDISSGKHTVTFKVWDIFNNSSQSKLDFIVKNDNMPAIQRVFNYPNPFSEYTNFFFEHNQTSENLDVTIEIYNLSGRKVREIKTNLASNGYTSGSIHWDGRDANGNKIWGGLYLYRIILRSSKGIVISNTQKMIVIQQ